MTPRQYAQLGKPDRAANLRESAVTRQVCDWLKARGWDCIRLHAGTVSKRGYKIRLGRKGRPDWLMVHPEHPAFFCEMKRNKGGKLNAEQTKQIELLERSGYKVATPASIEKFIHWWNLEMIGKSLEVNHG